MVIAANVRDVSGFKKPGGWGETGILLDLGYGL
jgi:hypothetical protein